MSFAILKDKFSYDGFTLTETSCISNTVSIKRNENGFYVLETKSLNSSLEYDNYLYGLEYLNRNKDDFLRLHQLLCEKELIMSGYYKVRKRDKFFLDSISRKLGYMDVREKILYEENPHHPSAEYRKIVKLLNINDRTNLDNRIKEVIEILNPYFIDTVKLVPKMIDEKYDTSFDNSYGVAIINERYGDMRMLYEVAGMDIIRSDAKEYLKEDCPYLDIYFKIIAKCIYKIYKKNQKNA